MSDDQPEDMTGTLEPGEVHPAAHGAMRFVKEFMRCNPKRFLMLLESFASTALSGNRLGDICCETARRIMSGEPVSDRYLLGLAWTLREIGGEHEKPKTRKSKRKLDA